LPYAEFAYNNSYQSNIKMAPFEALYGKVQNTIILEPDWRESALWTGQHKRSRKTSWDD
jgi:hypothetical protein